MVVDKQHTMSIQHVADYTIESARKFQPNMASIGMRMLLCDVNIPSRCLMSHGSCSMSCLPGAVEPCVYMAINILQTTCCTEPRHWNFTVTTSSWCFFCPLPDFVQKYKMHMKIVKCFFFARVMYSNPMHRKNSGCGLYIVLLRREGRKLVGRVAGGSGISNQPLYHLLD